jgi:Predicted ornithine cyclodeaminase, mu-crystallin homolog
MSENEGVLFVPYKDTLGLLNVEDAMRLCEQVYAMHARGSVVLSNPPSFKLDVADGFNNHWHVKSVFLKDIPTTGVRIYNYFDDGVRNTVGGLGCTRYIVLSDPHSGEPVAIVDEHWSYAIRSTAAATVACKWVGPKTRRFSGWSASARWARIRCGAFPPCTSSTRSAAPRGNRRRGRRSRTNGRKRSGFRSFPRIRSRRWCAAPISPSAAPRQATW